MIHLFAYALCLLVLLLGPDFAHAQDSDQCVRAYESAQELQAERRLVEAREQLVICGGASCPAMLRKDCARWLEEAEQATPGLVISVQEKGYPSQTIEGVSVTLDGAPLDARSRGRAVSVDPGEHRIHVEAPEYHPADVVAVALEGSKSMLVTVELEPLVPRPVVSVDVGRDRDAAAEEAKAKRIRTAAYVLGGVGVGVLGASTYFGITATKDAEDLRDSGCRPNCPTSDVDDARMKLIGANVGFGVGAGLLISALVMYLTHLPGDARDRDEEPEAVVPSVALDMVEGRMSSGRLVLRRDF